MLICSVNCYLFQWMSNILFYRFRVYLFTWCFVWWRVWWSNKQFLTVACRLCVCAHGGTPATLAPNVRLRHRPPCDAASVSRHKHPTVLLASGTVIRFGGTFAHGKHRLLSSHRFVELRLLSFVLFGFRRGFFRVCSWDLRRISWWSSFVIDIRTSTTGSGHNYVNVFVCAWDDFLFVCNICVLLCALEFAYWLLTLNTVNYVEHY